MIRRSQTGADWHRGLISDYAKGLFAFAARIGLDAGDSDETALRKQLSDGGPLLPGAVIRRRILVGIIPRLWARSLQRHAF